MTELLNYEIKSHRQGRTYDKSPHFYIQNKGLHSGRALNKPIANCFVVFTKTDEQREALYYLTLSLHAAKNFTFFIIGSVIPFIRIDDTRKVLNNAIQNYEIQQWEFKVEKLKKLTAYEENLKEQIKTIGQLKLAMLRA